MKSPADFPGKRFSRAETASELLTGAALPGKRHCLSRQGRSSGIASDRRGRYAAAVIPQRASMRHRVARKGPGCGIETADPSPFGIGARQASRR